MHTARLISFPATLLVAAVAFFTFASIASAATVVVSGNTSAGENQAGWLFNRDASTATPFAFNTDAASIGTGSLYVLPIGANALDKFIGELFLFAPMAGVNSISYDFKIGAPSDTVEEQFYMNVYANFGESDPLKFYDCRYNVVPTVGSTGAFTTVTFDPTQSYSVTTRGGSAASPHPCPASPADMDTLSPGSSIRVIALNVGDTSANDVGVSGYLDNVVVDLDSSLTTYDFDPEPVPPPANDPINKQECMKGGWEGFGFKNQGQCVRYIETGKDSRTALVDDSLGARTVAFIGKLFSWMWSGADQVAATIVPGQQKQIEKNIKNIDSDGNGYPDAGNEVTGKYVSVYAYDADDNWYWDLGDGRINGNVSSLDELNEETLTTCSYQVQYRGAFNNNAFLDSGWIINTINCQGYDDNGNYNYLIVHETDPRYRGNPEHSIWGTWEYHVLTESGKGNLTRPEKYF